MAGSTTRCTLAAVMVAAAVAACGGGGEAPGPAPAAAPAPAPAPAPPPEPPPTAVPDAANGRALYAQHCSSCHRPTPDERVLLAAGDGPAIVQAVGIVRIMNFLAPTIRPAQAQDIALWLTDPR